MGYQPLVAFELTRLCTRLRKTGNLAKRATTPYLAVKSYQNAFLGHLPQGAPTSPILANLVSFSLDVTLTALAEKRGLRYTRYADDLAFSTASISFSRDTAEDVIVECYSELRAHGYWPNRAKTNVVPPGARKVVLGLLVDGATPRLSREFKDRLRMHIYYMQSANVGPVKHAAKRGFDSVVGLQHHVLGMAAFAIGIEADWGKARMRELKAIQWPTAATLMP